MASKYDRFSLVSDFELRGDQARAIDELVDGLIDPNAEDTDGFSAQEAEAIESETEEEEEEEGDEEEDSRPQRVQGLGEEAYLTGNRRTSTLYVLKGDAVLRLSVSGPDERAAKLKRATALAAKALKRL